MAAARNGTERQQRRKHQTPAPPGSAAHAALENAKFVPRMRSEGVFGGQLRRDLRGKTGIEAAAHIDGSQLSMFRLGVGFELASLAREIRALRVGL